MYDNVHNGNGFVGWDPVEGKGGVEVIHNSIYLLVESEGTFVTSRGTKISV